MPARKKPEDPQQFKVGDSVSFTLHTRIVDGTVRAIVQNIDGVRLQVDYGRMRLRSWNCGECIGIDCLPC